MDLLDEGFSRAFDRAGFRGWTVPIGCSEPLVTLKIERWAVAAAAAVAVAVAAAAVAVAAAVVVVVVVVVVLVVVVVVVV